MGVTLRSNIPKIAASLQPKARMVVIKTIADLKAHAQQNAPVDTGQLRASIHGRTTRPLGGEVTVGVDYGLYVELGTSRMAAQPFLIPAAEAVRPAFEAAMGQIVAAGGGKGYTIGSGLDG